MSTSARGTPYLNPIHLARPVFEVLATLLHELAHAWQYEKGTGAKPPHHNQEFVERCEAMGIPTNAQGHYLGVLAGSPFDTYCQARGITVRANGTPSVEGGTEPEPLLPEPPAKPKGSRLKKWICGCDYPVPVRVARRDFDATCNVATDDPGAPFHRHHRGPGDRPVAPRRTSPGLAPRGGVIGPRSTAAG